jgi:long-chain acyl-CoA synthetase
VVRGVTLAEAEKRGREWEQANPDVHDQIASAVGPDDIATLIYTSGTTGKPKGVILTHDNWVFESETIDKLAVMSPSDRQYLFLPLSHSFAKLLEIVFIRLGVPTVIDGSIEDLVANLQETRPTVVGAVPRIFEKIYNKVVSGAQEAGGTKLRIFQWSLAVGRQVSIIRQRGDEPQGLLAAKAALADRLVFSKLKAIFGGRIKYFISGGAPLSQEIAEFFHASDILVLEGYGLTESSAASCVNRPEAYRFGTVGPALPGVEVRIAEDGEILLGGRGIMRGYYNLPQATAEALTEDGWLRTGDIGVLDDDGFVKITDRKKDIIVTAGGKNIAPQNLENTLKARCAYVSQVIMHGDRRNFCVALITISEDAVAPWARAQGLAFSDYASLSALPQVHDLIWEAVAAVNSELASYESIKKIALLDHDLSQKEGELTPTLKVKRRVVEDKNRDLLNSFYPDGPAKL